MKAGTAEETASRTRSGERTTEGAAAAAPSPWRSLAAAFADVTERVADLPVVIAVQRGLALVLPLIMVGAFALMVRHAPLPLLRDGLDALFGPGWITVCDALFSGSFGIAALAVLCAFSGTMAMVYNQRRGGQFVSPIMAAVVVLACFFVVTAPADTMPWRDMFSLGKGLLLAFAVSMGGAWLFLRLADVKALQLPLEAVGHDPVVRDILTVMPAGMLTIVAFGLLRAALVAAGITDLHAAASAAMARAFLGAGNDLGLGLAYVGLSQGLWFFGAHGPNLLFPIEESIFAPAGAANAVALAAGQAPPFVLTKTFFDVFTRMGGSGGTLCLIAAILYAGRDSGTRRLALMALLPALCNVNEPLLFGIPMVMNPVYLVPFLLVPLAQTVTAHAATLLHLVPYTLPDVVWTTPPLLNGYAATGSVAGSLMQVFNLGLGVALYLPFVRLSDELRERHGRRILAELLRTANGSEVGPGGRKCLDRPGEQGRIAASLANDLAAALARDGELFLEYQPQIGVDGRPYGAEALLRWRHPAYGRIAPPIAVALAEDTGIIDRLGMFGLHRACARRMAWAGQVPDDFVMSVNVAPRQLQNPRLDHDVLSVLARTGLAPHLLELELTESTVLLPDARTVAALRRLRAKGVRVAIDDFGMGHASLRYLRHFPVDTVKIDRSLTEASHGDVNEHIVRSIVDLARSLDITTVVEGVEQREQFERFAELGCQVFQGYLFSRPVSAARCLEVVAGWTEDAARTPDAAHNGAQDKARALPGGA
ncbi:PTS sugar transporter subunit IIC/EAL domain-containing protein [Nitratidesulfovibrio sp. 1201_IL3209]|uniref:PTS sugar transporter subunit IIC/EAL domain-containing protein n=1 Tax=Nitratidesulfovibrio sp. 1201_IL3209 TaxID=3084053 RepID=UPI002FDA77F5